MLGGTCKVVKLYERKRRWELDEGRTNEDEVSLVRNLDNLIECKRLLISQDGCFGSGWGKKRTRKLFKVVDEEEEEEAARERSSV
jgi:hypothetical protein